MIEAYAASIKPNIMVLRAIIQDLGVRIETGTDLNVFSRILGKQPLRHQPAPAFDPDTSCMPCEDALWMAGFDRKGELVCTQAIKLIDLGNLDFEAYLDERFWDFHPFQNKRPGTKTLSFLTEESRKISGRITYHGELWLKGGPNGVRGGCLAILFTRLLLLESLLRWSPDFMVGLQSPLNALQGLGVKESYTRLEQRSLIWSSQSKDEDIEGWLVWMTRNEAIFNLRIPARLFVCLYEPDEAVRDQVLSKVA